MKNNIIIQSMLILLVGVAQTAVFAGQASTNKLSVSARAGFNIKADFSYDSSGGAAVVPRTTPNGDVYNYDDGYVLTDVSGNAGGQTWYWGYDDSAAQVVGNEILMSQTTATGTAGGGDMDGATPFIGAEVVFSHQFETEEKWNFGFDFTASFLPLDFEDDSRLSASVSTTTDAFAFTGGTTPPTATPASPYQGTFDSPGFLISATPSSSSTIVAPSGVVNVHSTLDGNLWGARIGPYMEFPIGEDLVLHCSGGMSLGWLDVDVDWQASGATTAQGGGHDSETLSGAYLGANLFWHVAEDWRVSAGVQFEYLNDWEGEFGAGTVRLDLTRSLYATLGIVYDF